MPLLQSLESPVSSAAVRPAIRRPARERVDARTLAFAFALVAIVAVAVALRFVDLATNPGGLYPDEAAEGLDAARLLHWQGLPPVWFESDGGREALFAYFVAGAFAVFGQSVLVLRATSAALGVAAVVALALLGRRFGRAVSLVAAAWAAGSLWLVSIDRDGMRNGLVPLFGALALAALVWWSDRPSTRRAAIAGAVVSLSAIYTYQPLKLLPVLVVAWLWWLRHADRPAFDALKPGFRAFAVAFVAVAAPMAIVAFADPTNYFGRIAYVTPFNPEIQPEVDLPTHVIRTLGMFTFFGDPNARHDVAATPLLGPPLLAWPLFLLGCAGVVRLWRRRRDPAHALVLVALPVFFFAPLPAVEGGSPHFLRALGLAAPLAIAIGLGTVEVAEWAGQVVKRALAGGQSGWLAWVRSSGAVAAVGIAVACVLALQPLATASAYLSRPLADRYLAYSYDVAAMSAAAGPADAVVTNDHLAFSVRFLDAGREPAIFSDGSAIGDPAAFGRILSLDAGQLQSLAARSAGSKVEAVAFDPEGRPTVWALTP